MKGKVAAGIGGLWIGLLAVPSGLASAELESTEPVTVFEWVASATGRCSTVCDECLEVAVTVCGGAPDLFICPDDGLGGSGVCFCAFTCDIGAPQIDRIFTTPNT